MIRLPLFGERAGVRARSRENLGLGSMLPMDEERPIEDELRELAAAVREHVLWQKRTGAWGLPPAPPAQAEGPARRELPKIEVQESVPSRPPPSRQPVAPRDPEPAPARRPPPAPRAPAIEVPADPEQRVARLEALCDRTRACTACPLHEKRKQVAFARGNPAAELMFVGEGPGAEEDAQGLPFVGPAGQLLDKMIEAMGYQPGQVYICNIVKCRPPENRTPEPEEMAACMPFLHEQIAMVAPKVIVALGGTAARGLLGTTEGITRVRGKWKVYKASIPVMPTFHPSYLLRNPAAKREVWEDLKDVLKHLGRPLPEKKR